jgi:hypothetical protein
MMITTRRGAMGLALGAMLALGACVGGSGFETNYDQGIAPEVSRGWRVVAVNVTVPRTLVVSEAKTSLPRADIVWREDPESGDRYDQVKVIMENAIRQGAASVRGSRAVAFNVTMTRFHALTFEAENRYQNAGVHTVDFIIQVVDANTGATIVEAQQIKADFPALSGDQMRAARAQGQTQKKMITAHVAKTIQSWLGTGPDIRGSFTRSGG